MAKRAEETAPAEMSKEPMGLAPAVLAKRYLVKPGSWCPTPDIEYDAMCDADNPKTIIYKEVSRASLVVREAIPKTPLMPSKCAQFGAKVHYKFESYHRTGSFHERGALYALHMLNEEQRRAGVFTASLGNWGRALAYQACKFKIPLTVVFPTKTLYDVVQNCQDFGATVVLHGKDLSEAKSQAFALLHKAGCGTYINGYDHPHVIAAAGSIGLEIMDQLPQTDAILVPIGGGGLIAGIATAVKHLKPSVLIYGIEPVKCCNFFKAVDNERPYKTEPRHSLASSLEIPTAGYNAYQTASSLIDKMVILDDDWICRAILHLLEEEKMVVEGAGATSLAALLAIPDLLPELKEKTVVCVITGGNIDNCILPLALERAKAVEGRLIKFTIKLRAADTDTRANVLRIVANVGASIRNTFIEPAWLTENDLETIYLTLICETKGLEHACTLKRVMCRIFPNLCEFVEEPFSPIPKCVCFPKKILF